MSTYTEINIKEGMPFAVEALDYLKSSIERCRRNHYDCVMIIHGYGSTGKGGVICDKARQWLKAQERNGKMKTVIYGEDFSIFNPQAREMKQQYPELEQLFRVCNHGVTVVKL